jgi:formylglycine-generating enzyme required for sulfatase activity
MKSKFYLISLLSIIILTICYFHFKISKKITAENMVYIPGGEFLMSSDSRLARSNEKPAHKVRVSGF